MRIKNLKILMGSTICIIMCGTVQAQLKKNLTARDYSLWSEFAGAKMSADGNWTCVKMQYETADTLFLANKTKSRKYEIPNASKFAFAPNNKWFIYTVNNTLFAVDLKKNTKKTIETNVQNFTISEENCLTLVKNGATTTISKIDLQTSKTVSIYNTTEHNYSPDRTKILIVTKDSIQTKVLIFNINTTETEVLLVTGDNAKFSALTWDENSEKIAFLREIELPIDSVKRYSIYTTSYTKENGNLKILNAEQQTGFTKNSFIPFSKLYLSTKNNLVFFYMQYKCNKRKDLEYQEPAQIWHSEDSTIPPKSLHDSNELLYTAWDTEKDMIIEVEEEKLKNAVLTGNDDYAILFDKNELTPFYKYGGEFIAVYCKNLKTGEKVLISDTQTHIENQTMVSPNGKYIAYFKNLQWWIYNIKEKSHRCITLNMPEPLYRTDYDRPDLVPPCGSPGWTTNDENIIIYDSWDIWIITPDGKKRTQITNGKASSLVYRLQTPMLKQAINFSSFGFITQTIDLNTPQILQTKNDISQGQGFARLENGRINQLVQKPSLVYLLGETPDHRTLLCIESNFSLPPRIFTVNDKGQEIEIFQTNQHQQNYFWGTSKLINYTSANGKQLKAALFYPANYTPLKTYPMIVEIYEKKAKEVLDYTPPSLYSDHGFNVTNYTTQGYFVLMPDIAYNTNTTGNDALESVTAAVTYATTHAQIDAENIALIGHSFGGYEAAYIMGNSKIFKTAIIGAPMIDLVSAYLTLDGSGVSNMWRFEFDQFRLLDTFDSQVFIDNDPLKSVRNITAPLLIWTGTNDQQLDWKHAMKLHNALWRLGKKSTLLIYPDEQHVLIQKKNQQDLTKKYNQWLNYYLKNENAFHWMKKS